MKGYFRRRGCTCKKKRCTCGAKWSFTVDIGPDPATGERLQKTQGGFDTLEKAEEACNAIIYEVKNQTYVDESDILFKDFAKDWLNIYKKTHKVKISSVRTREFCINYLMPYLAHLKMKGITKKTYQEALNSLKDKGLADNTISGAHATGRMIFKKAMEYDLIKKDPTEFARVPRSQKTVEELEQQEKTVKYLEKDELSLLLKTAKEKGHERDYLFFLTLAYTGMRVGELCALKWKDIDFTEGTISITKTYYNPKHKATDYQLLSLK